MRTHSLQLTTCVLFAAGIACAHAQPSDELVKARIAYSNAENGPATALDPADLHEARVALDQAEDAASSDPQSFDARQRAYLALRRAELADAQGKTAYAAKQRDQDAAQEVVLKDQLLARTQGRLNASNAQNQQVRGALAESNAQNQQVQGALDASNAQNQQVRGALASTQGQLDSANQKQQRTDVQLQAEHDGRIAAEKKAMDALAKLGAVKNDERGLVLTLSGSVIFASNKSALLPSAERKLGEVANALRDSTRMIRVEGHTDSRGSDEKNQALSQRRAESVMNDLIAHDIAASRITAVGLGSSRPIADNGTAEGRANNRRVEVVLLRDSQPTAENQ